MTAPRWSIDHFIFEEYRTLKSSLGIYRILFAAYVLVYLPKHLWISHFPDSFFDPPIGPTMIFTGFPTSSFLVAVNAVAIVAAVCLLFGSWTRVASISFALSLFICDCWGYSFGKIDHDITLILIPLVMQAAGWGNGYSVDARRHSVDSAETTAWPLALMALMIGMAMMSAAVPKAASGWLDPHSHAVRTHMLYNVFVTGRASWFGEHLLRLKSGLLWEFFDYSTVLIEGSFLFAVVRRTAFRVVCALACFFHLGIALSMEIAFVGNILAYAANAEWETVGAEDRGLLRVWNRILDYASAPLVLGGGVAVAIVYLRFGNPLQLPQPWDPLGLAICLLSAGVAALFLMRRDWLRPSSRSVILFDGYCGLCDRCVDFIMRHDHRLLYRFAPLQSPAGRELLSRFELPTDFIDSFVLVEDERVYYRSSAVLRILRGLELPYSLAYLCIPIPRVIRDEVYRFVAARRYDWFSRNPTCRLPSPGELERFL